MISYKETFDYNDDKSEASRIIQCFKDKIEIYR